MAKFEPLVQEDEFELQQVQSNGREFDLTIKDLQELVDPKNLSKLDELGGIQGVCAALQSDLSKGLTEVHETIVEDGLVQEVPFGRRKIVFGKNKLPHKAQNRFWRLMLDALSDRTLIILMIAALASIAIGIYEDVSKARQGEEGDEGDREKSNEPGSWVEGIAILVTVLIITLINSLNDYQKEKQFRKLNARKEDRDIQTIRDGEKKQVSIFELVVGEVVLLSTGDVIPADGLLIEGHNLECDESAMTGESHNIKKNLQHDPFLLAGTVVTSGIGSMLVICVGPNSINGKVLISLQTEPEETPLQIKLGEIAENIGKAGLAAAILMFLVLILKYFLEKVVAGTPLPPGSEIANAIVGFIISAVTIVVVAVPEGLPMAVTLALAYATIQMLKDNNLVRVLAACETMGGATTICSDKTGTLTQNQMTVVKGKVGGKVFSSVDSISHAHSRETLEIIIKGVSVNSTAYESKDTTGKKVYIGSKTESALLDFVTQLGGSYTQIRESTPVVLLYPFSSLRKRMSTMVNIPGGYRLYCKGASEIVLAFCTHILNSDGSVTVMNEAERTALGDLILNLASDELRTIGIAYRDFIMSPTEFEQAKWEDPPETQMTWVGVVGIQDPLRPEVPNAIDQCKGAGIKVRMVTGDNVITARNIAKNCGILTKGGIVMEGFQFRRLSPENLDRILPNLQVLARSSPSDKQLLVERLRHLGETVAVTGDGTNDAPALKTADVGFSMGIAGTEIAKEASDIIVMDDNFASIVKAVIWGRSVYDSVRKFLQFQLTVNIAAVVLTFISAVTDGKGESVLTAVQLLWVNLIMDTMAALALATEPPSPSLLERKPLGKSEPLISYIMWKMIIGQALFQIGVNLLLLYGAPIVFNLDPNDPSDRAINRTLVFNTFIFMQVFNEINSRTVNDSPNIFKGMFRHKLFLIIFGITIVVQVLITQFGGVVFKTVPLNGLHWLASVGISFLSLPIGLIIRFIPICCVKQPPPPPHAVTREKLLWESAIKNVQIELKVVKMFRGRYKAGK